MDTKEENKIPDYCSQCCYYNGCKIKTKEIPMGKGIFNDRCKHYSYDGNTCDYINDPDTEEYRYAQARTKHDH
jgi:hypothetical protein